MNRAVLSLGSNVGDRKNNLEEAKKLLMGSGCQINKKSSIYETEPWGKKDQASFYNEVIEIHTSLAPEELMTTLLEIEEKMGRIRGEKWEPRIIDIDILFFNDEIIHEEHLTIPHPHLHERRFVLIPLKEILPEFVHPVLKKTASELLKELNDGSLIMRIES